MMITVLPISDISPYYGTLIGKLSNKEEGISGKIYAVDKNTVFIKNFTYIGNNSREFKLLLYYRNNCK